MTHSFTTQRASDLRATRWLAPRLPNHTRRRHEAQQGLPHRDREDRRQPAVHPNRGGTPGQGDRHDRSEEHTSELQSLMRISYDVFCLKKTTRQFTLDGAMYSDKQIDRFETD